MSKAYKEGNEAYFARIVSIENNPYEEGTDEFYDWEDGFVDGWDGIYLAD